MPGYPQLALVIDGQWIRGGGREEIPVINPSTEEVLGYLPRATPTDLDAALASVGEASVTWGRMSAYARARILTRAADILRERVEEIAQVMTLEQGKTIVESRTEARNLGDILDWDAEEGRRAYGRIIPARVREQRQFVLKEPIGPVATFTPWNFPALIPVRKVSAVLAAGCACIIKPAEETPATALVIAKALEEAGLPKGVLNVVFGVPSEISGRLIPSPVIRGISFTGSTAVGKHLSELAARGIKRTVMELGGHSPVLVFDDADPETVAQASAVRKFRNAGQGCVNPTRYYVHDSIYERFRDTFITTVAKIVPGDGFAPESTMGPLAHARRIDAMKNTVEDAIASGAKLLAGGRRIERPGYFWEPTILGDVPASALIMNEEPFGPVAVLNRWSDYDAVIAEANRTPYGLAAYAFTPSGSRACRVQDDLQAGMIGINTYALGAPDAIGAPETPFGGIKESGYGSEGGIEGLDAYLAIKFVSQI